MKFRTDFVTNSSSSSFICEICGNTKSGYDISFRDTGFCECTNGHTICQEHLLETENIKEKFINEILKNSSIYTRGELECEDILYVLSIYDEIVDDDIIYNIPEELCPICQFVEYSESELVKYLELEYKISKATVFGQVKQINKRRKKLYDSEYITYVCKEFNLDPTAIVASWKEKYKTYKNFRKAINNR